MTCWTLSLSLSLSFSLCFIFLLTKTFFYGRPLALDSCRAIQSPRARYSEAESLVVLLIERKGFRYSSDAICNRASRPIEWSLAVDCIDDATTARADLLISFICCLSPLLSHALQPLFPLYLVFQLVPIPRPFRLNVRQLLPARELSCRDLSAEFTATNCLITLRRLLTRS